MPLRILVVEDHAPFRRLICAAVQRRAGVQTFEAADGLDAVQKAEALQPDLILLDINLPKMHGFEVAARVRRLAPRARLLFLTQESSPEILREALSLGALGYVQKISAATDLMPAIDAALAGERFVSRGVTGSGPAGASAPRRHELLFCSSDAAAVDALSRFVADTLKAAGAAIVVATAAHWLLILRELRTHGVNVDDAIARGACVLFDADVAPDGGRILEAIDRARAGAASSANPHPRVVLCGERAGRLWAAGRTADALRLEGLCHELPHDIDILCTYPVPDKHDDEVLARIRAMHTTVCAA